MQLLQQNVDTFNQIDDSNLVIASTTVSSSNLA